MQEIIKTTKVDILTASERCELIKVIDLTDDNFTFSEFYHKYENLVKNGIVTFVGGDSTLREWCIKEGWWIKKQGLIVGHWNVEYLESELSRLVTEVYEQEPITIKDYKLLKQQNEELKQQNELIIKTLEYLLNELKK